MRKTLFPLFFLIAFSLLVSNVYATQVDLDNFPERLGLAFNISTFAGGILASCLVMLMFMIPVAIYTKTFFPPLFLGFIVLGFCVAIDWLPTWFLLIETLMIALLFGSKVRTWISGR